MDNVKKRLIKLGIFFVSIVVIFVFLFSGKLKNISVDFIGVPSNFIYSIFHRLEEISSFFKDKKSLYQENEKLKKELEILKLENQKVFQLEKENEELRKVLQFKNQYTSAKIIVARVIAFSPDNWVNSFFIDVGSKDGVKEGDFVVAGGYLIGMVKSVGLNSSEVLSVNDENFKITVRTRKTGEICFYSGLGYKKGVLKYVRPEQDIRFSDIVETTILDRNGLEGIPVGIIKKISTKEGEFFKEVEVETFYYPYSLDYVIVVSR
ncbi:MAG: rod shape-determining protein MreC [Sulfurihydrogenibium sp.]|uniref:rod shape-determining protein MreC n=1 Tax=Sulfurihydrogenibium sp. TaxID=2053621 RepID=UPI003D123D30